MFITRGDIYGGSRVDTFTLIKGNDSLKMEEILSFNRVVALSTSLELEIELQSHFCKHFSILIFLCSLTSLKYTCFLNNYIP